MESGARILVTGASGLAGANLVLEFSRRGYAVIAVYGRHPIHMDGVPAIACDLTDAAAARDLLHAHPADLVVHCAAATNVDWCEEHPAECMRLNGELPGILAAQCRSAGTAFVHLSTDAVFDGLSGGYAEDDAVHPVNWYARGKAAGEAAVLREFPKALVLRLNLYGWNMQAKSSLAEWVLRRLEAGQQVPGFADTVFAPVLVNALAGWILPLCELGCSGIYHAGSSDYCSKYEFARKLAMVFGLDDSLVAESRMDASALTAPRPRCTWLRTGKLAATLGEPMPTVREGLEEFRRLRENGFVSLLTAAAAP